MAARSIASLSLSFGLVSIPIKLYTATAPGNISFNLLHAKCGSRIKQQTFCPTCNETIERAALVRGYEFSKDQYVRVTDDELKGVIAHELAHLRELVTREPLVTITGLGGAGMGVLYTMVNPLTMWLTFVTFVGYALVYTVLLKPNTPQNIVIGGLSGAMPPALGWAAVANTVPMEAWLLVLIIFVWTPPHFWALAIFRREDYRKAMVPMLPVTHGVEYTRWQILFYTVLLVVVTVLPFAAGMSGWFYVGGALVLGIAFIWHAWKLMNPPDELYAMKVFSYSIVYLMALFAFLLVDHWIAPLLAPPPAFELQPMG